MRRAAPSVRYPATPTPPSANCTRVTPGPCTSTSNASALTRIVTVLHEGEPHVPEWMALLDACGFVLEPMRKSSPEPDVT